MTLTDRQYLFMSTEVGVVINQSRQNAVDAIHAFGTDGLLAHSVDEWVAELTDDHRIEVPTIDAAQCFMTEAEGYIPQYAVPNPNFREPGSATVKGTIYTFHIPYVGNRGMLYVKPTQHPIKAPIAASTENEILITIAGAWLDKAAIDKECDDNLALIQQYLDRLGKDVEPFNQALPSTLCPLIETRRTAAEASKATSASLKYPIKPRANAPTTYRVPALRRKVTRPASTPTTPGADPVLEEEHYKHILSVIENMTSVMERSPSVFAHLEEEHIRFHYLVQLNAQYDGEAVGEAFNYRGKTDILVRHQNQNLFIAECKFWDGAKTLTETINQILSYVTWRDTKTAIILFVNRKDFSPVVTSAVDTMKQHGQYVSGPQKEGETRFRYIFKHPNDPNRYVTITLMMFNIPKA
jgi:hypothetical protein